MFQLHAVTAGGDRDPDDLHGGVSARAAAEKRRRMKPRRVKIEGNTVDMVTACFTYLARRKK